MFSDSEKSQLLDSGSFNYDAIMHSKYSWLVIGILTTVAVAASTDQAVTLPLWLASFGNNLGGPYLILLLSSLFSVLFFAFLYIITSLTNPDCKTAKFSRWLPRYIAMGFFDALNGLMVVYVSNPNRVPPVLLSILPNTVILWMLLFTKLLIPSKRKLSYFHPLPILSVVLVYVGVGISLVPTIQALIKGTENFFTGSDAVIYTAILLLAQVPAVIFNVLQEKSLTERELDDSVDRSPSSFQPFFDQIVILFWSCFFSLLTVMICFGVDLIPRYGASKSLHQLVHDTAKAFRCVFGGCSRKVLLLGVLFNLGWCFDYTSTIALNAESANYAAIGSVISAPLAAIFFLVFPKVLPTGSPANPPLWSVVPALLLSLAGTVLWKYWERTLGPPIRNRALQSVNLS